MNVLEISNPIITTDILLENFLKMEGREYTKTLKSTLQRARQFAFLDDSEFSTSLSIGEATQYADLVRTFLDHLKKLEQLANAPQINNAGEHALVLAWWQVISAFRTMHGAS
jgi:hypothetical protein